MFPNTKRFLGSIYTHKKQVLANIQMAVNMFKETSLKMLFFDNLLNIEYYIGVSNIGKINCNSFMECLLF